MSQQSSSWNSSPLDSYSYTYDEVEEIVPSFPMVDPLGGATGSGESPHKGGVHSQRAPLSTPLADVKPLMADGSGAGTGAGTGASAVAAVGASDSPRTDQDNLPDDPDARYETLMDANPDTVYFRRSGSKRPSIRMALTGRAEPEASGDEEEGSGAVAGSPADDQKSKFGTFEGVFARCLLNIWGVLMFLRLGWIVGHAGVWYACLIVVACMIVTTITTLSLSAICTNGEVFSGGAYYMISRSLGPEFGGAIGILFSIANAGAVSLHLVGFAETVVESVFPDGYHWTADDGAWDQTLVAMIALVFLVCIALVGVAWVVKFQLSLLVLLVFSILSYVIGTFGDEDESLGFTSYSGSTLDSNFSPLWRSESFFTLFSVFFPASTGIMAGANISGDLKDAQNSIPRGTLAAVAVSGVVYIVLIWMLGATLEKEVPGSEPNGLLHNNEIMIQTAFFGPLIIAGIFAAGLSSALAALVGAPRVFQAVCEDGLFPALKPFAVGRGANNEPVRAYVLTFLIAGGVMCIGDLNAIAPLITNFFMISYAFINYACFATDTAKVPGWRPSFTYFNRWVALVGTFLCIVLMFVINYIFSLATIIVAILLYKYVDWQENDVNWGSARQAKIYLDALKQTARLEITQDHVKTYRPAFLVLPPGAAEDINSVIDLVLFVDLFAGVSNGVLSLGAVVVGSFDTSFEDYLAVRNSGALVNVGVTGFIDSVIAPSIAEGHRLLLQTAGVGKLRPNTIVIPLETPEVMRTVREALVLDYSTVLVSWPSPLGLTPSPPSPSPTGTLPRIDVWWMAADGGLPLLMAWLLRQNKPWRKTALRVIAGGLQSGNNTTKSLNVLLPKLQRMLNRFRIPFTDTEIVDLTVAPSAAALSMWDSLHTPTSNERMHAKTRRYLRQWDLMSAMSADAALTIVTMPLPARGVAEPVWNSWCKIHMIDGVQTILVRGSHEDVLTYYS